MINRVASILIFLSASSLFSCGWQLRGNHSSGDFEFERVALQFQKKSSELRPYLRQHLQKNKIAIVDKINDSSAEIELVIHSEKLTRRPLAMNETGVTIQYQLILRVEYSYLPIIQGEKQFLPKRTFFSQRNYDFDPEQISAEEKEQQALLSEMRQELAARILSAMPSINDTIHTQ